MKVAACNEWIVCKGKHFDKYDDWYEYKAYKALCRHKKYLKDELMGSYYPSIFSQLGNITSLGTISNVYYSQIGTQTTANSYGGLIYQTWIADGTATTTINTQHWNINGLGANVYQAFDVAVNGMTVSGTVREPTPAELQKMEEDKRRRDAARQRARDLLCSTLTDQQREQLHKENAFDLEVAGRIYRIRPGRKVERLALDGKAEALFCIHPDFSHGLPEDDVALSQKLLLEADEAAFLRIANKFAA
jgi:hypothetical protein